MRTPARRIVIAAGTLLFAATGASSVPNAGAAEPATSSIGTSCGHREATVDLSLAAPATATIYGTEGDDVIVGTAGDDRIDGLT